LRCAAHENDDPTGHSNGIVELEILAATDSGVYILDATDEALVAHARHALASAAYVWHTDITCRRAHPGPAHGAPSAAGAPAATSGPRSLLQLRVMSRPASAMTRRTSPSDPPMARHAHERQGRQRRETDLAESSARQLARVAGLSRDPQDPGMVCRTSSPPTSSVG
jgi:hypothetical protein